MAQSDGGLVKCEVCDKAMAKYTCPRCELRSCSLECVKAHKEARGCSGKRNRTAFVGRGQFDERAFMSDYRFLEEVKLADDVAKRSRPPPPKPELPPFLKTLVYQARRRGVQLHILPPGMEKRRANTMRYDGRQQLFSWHVEWSFPAVGCKVADGRVDERRPLQELLGRHLRLRPGEALVHEGLQAHIDAGPEQLTVVLRRERSPANAVEYHLIDTKKTLQQQLAGKVIVEYPTFLVLLPREVGQYRIVGRSQGIDAEQQPQQQDEQQRGQQVQQQQQPPPPHEPPLQQQQTGQAGMQQAEGQQTQQRQQELQGLVTGQAQAAQ